MECDRKYGNNKAHSSIKKNKLFNFYTSGQHFPYDVLTQFGFI